MCTITYLPINKEAFILTSNRDESKVRPTQPPAIENLNKMNLLYPRDSFAGGTWICLSDLNRVACLMNGAFEKHEWKPPYRKSRGLVMLDLFRYDNVSDFIKDYDLKGIEPFTMIIYDNLTMTEFRWDGVRKYDKAIEILLPHIWSSASLYPKPVRDKREEWFKKWLDGKINFRQDEILEFHRFGGEGDLENDFVMNRYNIVQTVSITSIIKMPGGASMRYQDLVENNITEASIQFRDRQVLESH